MNSNVKLTTHYTITRHTYIHTYILIGTQIGRCGFQLPRLEQVMVALPTNK